MKILVTLAAWIAACSGIGALCAQESEGGDSPANPLSSLDGRSFEGRLAPHESIYFLYGADDPAAKFQFSFKYRLFYSDEEVEESSAPRTSVNIAYTQRSLWDTEADSSPFYDTSYMPELIFESAREQPSSSGPFTWFGYQAAVKHESNGRDGSSSRGQNIFYMRPVFAIGPLDGWHMVVSPKAYFYITPLDNNPDLPDYRGYGQLEGAILKKDAASLAYMVRSGKDFDRVTYQLDLAIPVRVDFLDLATYLHVQYFDGYGESMLSYAEESEVLRVGFSLVR